MENDQATVVWYPQIITDRYICCKKPDIVIKEEETARCIVMEVEIPSDNKIQKKNTEKMSQCIDL